MSRRDQPRPQPDPTRISLSGLTGSSADAEREFRAMVRRIDCPDCAAKFTDSAVEWGKAWCQGQYDRLLAAGISQRDGPFKLKCARCGHRSYLDYFRETVRSVAGTRVVSKRRSKQPKPPVIAPTDRPLPAAGEEPANPLRVAIRALACTACGEPFTDYAIEWGEAYREGQLDYAEEAGEPPTEAAFQLQCELCGHRSAFDASRGVLGIGLDTL